MNLTSTNTSINPIIPGLGAVVLCGGKSRRMGKEKSQLKFLGKTLLEHVVERIAKVADPIVIAGGEFADPESRPDGTWFVPDAFPESGPLAGICPGLQRLQAHCQFAFVSGCDSPLVEPGLIRYLFEQIGSHQTVVPCDGPHVYGLTAIYRTSLASDIHRLVENSERRVASLAEHFDTRRVELKDLRAFDSELVSLLNVNTVAEYDQLNRRRPGTAR